MMADCYHPLYSVRVLSGGSRALFQGRNALIPSVAIFSMSCIMELHALSALLAVDAKVPCFL